MKPPATFCPPPVPEVEVPDELGLGEGKLTFLLRHLDRDLGHVWNLLSAGRRKGAPGRRPPNMALATAAFSTA